MFVMNRQIEFPYFPILSKFSDHPAAKGLEGVIMPFVSAISYLPKDSSVQIQPLVFSSENSGVVNTPVSIDIQKQWTESDFNAPSQVVAVAAEGPLSGNVNSKMVVIANGSYAVNGEGQQQQLLLLPRSSRHHPPHPHQIDIRRNPSILHSGQTNSLPNPTVPNADYVKHCT